MFFYDLFVVVPPSQDDLTSGRPERSRRGSQSTLAVPERPSTRRPRTPSPSRELGMERERNRSSRDERLLHRDDLDDYNHGSKTPVAMDDYRKAPGEMTLAEQYVRYQPDDRIHRQERDSPPRRQNRRLSPTEYEYGRMQGSRRSRSPSRRDEVHRRSHSEARSEMEYERHQHYSRNRARTPVQALDTSSLPNSPIHGGGSPSSTPSTPRKHRQLPQVPAVSKADKGKLTSPHSFVLIYVCPVNSFFKLWKKPFNGFWWTSQNLIWFFVKSNKSCIPFS